MLFECHPVPVHNTMKGRKRKFLHKFRMLSNQLRVLFKDKATAILNCNGYH